MLIAVSCFLGAFCCREAHVRVPCTTGQGKIKDFYCALKCARQTRGAWNDETPASYRRADWGRVDWQAPRGPGLISSRPVQIEQDQSNAQCRTHLSNAGRKMADASLCGLFQHPPIVTESLP